MDQIEPARSEVVDHEESNPSLTDLDCMIREMEEEMQVDDLYQELGNLEGFNR